MWTSLEFLALVLVDPDEQFWVLVWTDIVRDAVSAVLCETLFLGDHFQTAVTHRQLHIQACLASCTRNCHHRRTEALANSVSQNALCLWQLARQAYNVLEGGDWVSKSFPFSYASLLTESETNKTANYLRTCYVCSCDLDPTTLIYELKTKFWKMYPHIKNQLSRSGISKSYRLSDIQTDRRPQKYTPAGTRW